MRGIGEALRQLRVSGPVHVQVGGMPGAGGESGGGVVDDPGGRGRQSRFCGSLGAATSADPFRGPSADRLGAGAVELVAGNLLPRPGQQRIRGGLRQRIAQGQSFAHPGVGRDDRGQVRAIQRAGEIEQPSAFGDGGYAGLDCGPQVT